MAAPLPPGTMSYRRTPTILPVVGAAGDRVDGAVPKVLPAVGGPYEEPMAVPNGGRLRPTPDDPAPSTGSYSTFYRTRVILRSSQSEISVLGVRE